MVMFQKISTPIKSEIIAPLQQAITQPKRLSIRRMRDDFQKIKNLVPRTRSSSAGLNGFSLDVFSSRFFCFHPSRLARTSILKTV